MSIGGVSAEEAEDPSHDHHLHGGQGVRLDVSQDDLGDLLEGAELGRGTFWRWF